MATTTRDVGDAGELREIVRRQYGGDIAVRFRSHGRVENAAFFGVLGQIHEDALRVALCERAFACTQRMLQVAERIPEHRQPEHPDVIPERGRMVGAKEARCLGMMPGSIFPLENANRGQQAQYAVKRQWLRAGGFRQRLGGLWQIAEGIGHSQLSNDVQAPGRPTRGGELHDLDVGGAGWRSGAGRSAGVHRYLLRKNAREMSCAIIAQSR